MKEIDSTLYDCAIIGGGLAGLTLAIQLAKVDKKVILFEKEVYPFHKVCGEYIAMESWNFLERLGVPLREMNLPLITNLKISSPKGKVIEHALNPGGFGISRFSLDKILFDIAQKSGVEIRTNTKVEEVNFKEEQFFIKTKEEEFTARLVCGAYGKRSNLDVKLQRDFIQNTTDYVAVKYHVKANLANDLIELHNFKDGYCGISKVDGERYCMCYLTTSQNLKNNNNSIAEMERNVLMKNPFLKNYFMEFPSLYEKPLVISQVNFSKKTAVENHMLMLGDAAGLITPLCGNGMSMAMNASKISFGYILEFLNEKISRNELENRYQKEWKINFNTRLKAGRIIQHFFGNENLTTIFIKSLKPFPWLIHRLISLTHGEKF